MWAICRIRGSRQTDRQTDRYSASPSPSPSPSPPPPPSSWPSPSAQLLIVIAVTCLSSIAVVAVVHVCLHAMDVVWWSPRRQARIARQQGLRGPAPSFLLGNVMQIKRLRESSAASLDPLPSFSSHDLTVQHLLPDHVLWTQVYGI